MDRYHCRRPAFPFGDGNIRTRRKDSELSLDFRLTSAFDWAQLRA